MYTKSCMLQIIDGRNMIKLIFIIHVFFLLNSDLIGPNTKLCKKQIENEKKKHSHDNIEYGVDRTRFGTKRVSFHSMQKNLMRRIKSL